MSGWRNVLWLQFGAAIDMLENGIRACPDDLWAEEGKEGWYQFWYYVHHCLFFIDYYASDPAQDFAPPPPITDCEEGPEGLRPPRPHAKEDLLGYLAYGRAQCKAHIETLPDDAADRPCGFESRDLTTLVLYNMRHVQHHAAQLHLLLRQHVGDAPLWVSRARAT